MESFGPLSVDVRPLRKGWLSVVLSGPRGRTQLTVRDLGLRGAAAARAVLGGLSQAYADPERFRRTALDVPMPDEASRRAFIEETETIVRAARRAGPAVVEASRISGPEGDAMDLKRMLMELGNRLVSDMRFDPSGPIPPEVREALRTDHTTEPIVLFTEWLNLHPEAQDVLAEMGVQWRMPR